MKAGVRGSGEAIDSKGKFIPTLRAGGRVAGLRPVRSAYFRPNAVEALALDYVVGDTPEAGDWGRSGEIAFDMGEPATSSVRVEEIG